MHLKTSKEFLVLKEKKEKKRVEARGNVYVISLSYRLKRIPTENVHCLFPKNDIIKHQLEIRVA